MQQRLEQYWGQSSLLQRAEDLMRQGWVVLHISQAENNYTVIWGKQDTVTVTLSPKALVWLASSPDPEISAEATSIIAEALSRGGKDSN